MNKAPLKEMRNSLSETHLPIFQIDEAEEIQDILAEKDLLNQNKELQDSDGFLKIPSVHNETTSHISLLHEEDFNADVILPASQRPKQLRNEERQRRKEKFAQF